MFAKISKRLEALALKVIENDTATTFKPTVILHNPETGFKCIPKLVDSIDIVQNFSDSYLDAIQVVVPLEYPEYLAMMENVQDLECTITLYAANPTTGREYTDIEPIIIKARAILENQEDISKTVGSGIFTNGEDSPATGEQASAHITYTFHLIEHSAFDLRHVGINAIMTNCTIEQVIHYVCAQFGINNVQLVTPDNDMVYSNLVIPPMKNMSNVFSFLQERYGIYSKGLSWFYTQDTIYIYPAFDTTVEKNTAKGILRLVSVPKGTYVGCENYHLVYNKDMYILSNTERQMSAMNSVGEENAGGARLSVNSDNTVDGFSTLTSEGTLEISNDNVSILQMTNKKGSMSSKSSNIKYDGIRSNIFVSTSEMAMYNGTAMKLGWINAIPRSIVPGQVLEFYYDESAQIFATKKGRVQQVSYRSMTQNSRTKGQPVFSFVAELSLFLDPEKSEE